MGISVDNNIVSVKRLDTRVSLCPDLGLLQFRFSKLLPNRLVLGFPSTALLQQYLPVFCFEDLSESSQEW